MWSNLTEIIVRCTFCVTECVVQLEKRQTRLEASEIRLMGGQMEEFGEIETELNHRETVCSRGDDEQQVAFVWIFHHAWKEVRKEKIRLKRVD